MGETGPRPDEVGFRQEWSWRKRAMALGACAVTVIGAGASVWDRLNGDGDVNAYGPYVQLEPEIDNYTNVATWNMKNQVTELTPTIRKVIDEHKLDFFLIQEGTVGAAKRLAEDFPDFQILHMRTDAKQEFSDNGSALIIMSRQEIPEDDRSGETFKGPSLPQTVVRAVKALQIDAVDSAFAADLKADNLEEAFQETRGVMAVTAKVQIGSAHQDVRIINLHNSPYRKDQGEMTTKIIKFIDKNIEPGRPAVVCGDFNVDSHEMIPILAESKLITSHTDITTDDKRVLDMCFQYTAYGKLGLADIKVLSNVKGSDHRIVVFRSRSEPSTN